MFNRYLKTCIVITTQLVKIGSRKLQFELIFIPETLKTHNIITFIFDTLSVSVKFMGLICQISLVLKNYI